MWFTQRFKRPTTRNPALALFDEGFFRRMERLNFRTAPGLRGALGGERRSRTLRPALDFSDHRPYTPGDDLRHVDWNAYSRHDDLFVKLGETTQSITVHLLLDASPSMGWTPWQSTSAEAGLSPKWDSARRLAGAMGYLGLSGGERVELTAFARRQPDRFGPAQGKRQAIPMLKYLTGLAPAQDSHAGLTESLAAYARRHPAGGLFILISDLLDTAPFPDAPPGDVESLAEALHFFPAPRWQVLVLHLLTGPEIDPSLDGDYDLRDMETGRSLPFHFDDATLAQYRLRLKSWCARLQHDAAGRAATYARIPAEWPLEKAVIPYLRQRGAVQ
jgi:hypothetical protein